MFYNNTQPLLIHHFLRFIAIYSTILYKIANNFIIMYRKYYYVKLSS